MLGVLKDLETAVIAFWRAHRDLGDHAVARVYETALDRYDAERRGRRPRPHRLAGDDLELFERILAVCEYRLGRAPKPEQASADVPAQPPEMIAGCLRELGKSVATRTRAGGRQGYLEYVSQFLPKI